MKSFTLLLFCCAILFSGAIQLQAANLSKKEIPKVEKLETAPNLFKCENMFFSGQPSLQTLEWAQKQGVDLIINLRSDDENDEFSETAFNEKDMASKLEMQYISLPIAGYDSYSPENLAKFAEALKGKYKKVFIHCRSAGRVTYFMMAYLVEYKGYELSEAIEFGKQIKFTFPLEYLLKEEINWQLK